MQYEPTIEELRHKYEVAMKEKMLVRLEKERLQARTEALEAQVMHFCWALPPGPPTLSHPPHPLGSYPWPPSLLHPLTTCLLFLAGDAQPPCA